MPCLFLLGYNLFPGPKRCQTLRTHYYRNARPDKEQRFPARARGYIYYYSAHSSNKLNQLFKFQTPLCSRVGCLRRQPLFVKSLRSIPPHDIFCPATYFCFRRPIRPIQPLPHRPSVFPISFPFSWKQLFPMPKSPLIPLYPRPCIPLERRQGGGQEGAKDKVWHRIPDPVLLASYV